MSIPSQDKLIDDFDVKIDQRHHGANAPHDAPPSLPRDIVVTLI